MATISGKRFQITDGASTPTNLFPYTVTEAVYGLSTVIEAAKTAVTNSLTAVTLNGVSKAGTTASFYAPAASGTTGQILKATTSGAPVWTSAALGASNKPIYLNSSGVLTEGVACVKTSGDTMTGALTITGSADTLLAADTAHSTASYIRLRYNTGGTAVTGYIGLSNGKLVYYSGGDKEIWHAGNSNKSDVAWVCSTLGAGTATPTEKLEVNGGNAILNNTSGATITLTGAARNGNNGAILFMDTYPANGQRNGFKIASEYTASQSRQSLVFYSSNNTTSPYTPVWAAAMTIRHDGYIGIGTTAPEQKLHIAGSLRVQRSATQTERCDIAVTDVMTTFDGYDSDGAMAFRWMSNSTERMRIDTAGNVGIGTNAPDSLLYVNGLTKIIEPTSARFSITMNSPQITLSNISSAYPSGGWTAGLNAGTDGTSAGCIAGVYMTGSTIQRYWYGGTSYSSPLMVILPGGNVGIGTTAPSQKLHVAGTILSTGDQTVSSDASLKTNLKDVTYSVSDIAACRAVTFDWKDGRGHSAGSIAQDWKPLIPELVHGEEGNMTLAYGQIALVNTILLARKSESHEERIKELEARVAELEMENERLRMN